MINAEKAKGDNANAANIATAQQNIQTLRNNAKTEIQNNRVARQKGYADEAVSLVADWMERTGNKNEDGTYKDIDEQSLASVLSPKQLWYFQKFNNKGSNWGNALGGRSFLGELNNTTVSRINQMAKEKLGAKQKQEESVKYSDTPLKTSTGADMVVGNVAISNKKINEMKDWGDGITDVNAISPEKVQQLYQKLESYGVSVPKEPVLDEQGRAVVDENNEPVMQYAIGNDSYTIDTILDELDDDGDMVLEALGFRDSQTGRLAVPHHKTYDEILADRERAQEELRHINEQKALQRQQARLGLADLAAGIGDIIKASGGAIVTPRDYQAMYNSLTEQQKTNYNNYLARMQALKEQEKAKQKEAADRAYQERLLKEKYAREDALLADARLREDFLLEQAHERELEKIRARGQNSLAVQKEKNKATLEKFNSKRIINFGGINYTYPEGSKNSVISQLLPIVKPYFNDTNGYKSMLSGIQTSQMNEFGKGEEIANLVICAINDPYLYLSEDDKDNIVNVLKGLSSERVVAGGTAATGRVPSGTPAASTKVKIKNKTTGAISEVDRSVYDGWLQSVKSQYEEVVS